MLDTQGCNPLFYETCLEDQFRQKDILVGISSIVLLIGGASIASFTFFFSTFLKHILESKIACLAFLWF